ncbi:hypothetical protein FLA105534_01845 [Flavobacterium bizetiae]|nr:hypothetical protein FLA105534_01845 [Flavobacterium bizetiae]
MLIASFLPIRPLILFTVSLPATITDFVTVSVGVSLSISVPDVSETGLLLPSTPSALAEFTTFSAIRSACVTVCVAVKLADAPGRSTATLAGLILPESALASVIKIFLTGTLPALVTTKS